MDILNRLKVGAKLYILVGLTLVALVGAAVISGYILYGRMYEDRIATVRAAVEEAVGIAKSLDEQVKAGKIGKDEALDRFRQMIYAVRYAGGEYVFSNTMQGVVVVNGANRSLQGQNRWGSKDEKGTYIVREQAKTLRGEAERFLAEVRAA